MGQQMPLYIRTRPVKQGPKLHPVHKVGYPPFCAGVQNRLRKEACPIRTRPVQQGPVSSIVRRADCFFRQLCKSKIRLKTKVRYLCGLVLQRRAPLIARRGGQVMFPAFCA